MGSKKMLYSSVFNLYSNGTGENDFWSLQARHAVTPEAILAPKDRHYCGQKQEMLLPCTLVPVPGYL